MLRQFAERVARAYFWWYPWDLPDWSAIAAMAIKEEEPKTSLTEANNLGRLRLEMTKQPPTAADMVVARCGECGDEVHDIKLHALSHGWRRLTFIGQP